MADPDTVRIELAFEGGPIVAAVVKTESADALERAVTAGAGGSLAVDTEDGRIVIVTPRVVYLKRFARDARVGFGLE